ncbi:receptor-type tyrosine-protein phosphatase H [Amia ocellicauda]|uniref:receptor-type tyrosine-protein phosphatase H n=1 Tax=Amia ocellicauda TaxID=2972642 RepID=UPI0034649499
MENLLLLLPALMCGAVWGSVMTTQGATITSYPHSINCTQQNWTVTTTTIKGVIMGDFTEGKATKDGLEIPANRYGDTIEFSGLQSGCLYNVSLWHNNMLLCSIEQSTVAARVSNLTVTPCGNTSLSVNWTRPSGCVKEYSVYNNITNIFNVSENTNSKTIENLTPGTVYNITVVTLGDGESSEPATKLENTGLDCNSLTWSPGVGSLEVVLTHGQVSRVSAQNTDVTVVNATLSGSKANVSGLDPGCNYNVSVWSWIDTVLCTRQQGLVGAPVSSLSVFPVNSTALSVWWRAAQGCVQKYTVCCNNITCTIVSSERNSTIIGGLKPGSVCAVTVSTEGEGGSKAARPVTNNTEPSHPLILQINTTSNSVHVNWAAPHSTDLNYKQYSYWVECVRTTQSTDNCTKTTKLLFIDFSFLHPGELYNVTVRSEFNNIQGEPITVQTLTNPLSPTNFSVSTVSVHNASLSWRKVPADASGLTNYLVTYISPSEIKSITSDTDQLTLSELTPGQNYSVSLVSVVTAGQLTKYSEVQHSRFQTYPAAVSSLQCVVESGGYTLGLRWTPPPGVWQGVRVHLSGSGSPQQTVPSNTMATSFKGLQPARNYNIMVKAFSGDKFSQGVVVVCKTDPAGVIAGTVIGFLALLILVIFLILFIRRKPDLFRARDFVESDLSSKRLQPIPIKKFADHVARLSADENWGFSEEYEALSQVGVEQTTKAALIPENKSKNRFTNVLPYDWSRVKLKVIDDDLNSDYINANYMPGYGGSGQYIAAQGPLSGTLAHFWRLLWEQGVNTLVMLTSCIEGGRVKCEQYWPLDYTPCCYGPFCVTVTSERKDTHWTVRDMTVKQGSEVRSLTQFHFTAWPDHGVPEGTSPLTRFRTLVRQHIDISPTRAPVLVHCSAGVGRTGTLIALDTLLQQAETHGSVGVAAFVHKMRLSRPLMVQTESQYIFLHQCLLDSLCSPPPPTLDESIYENTDMLYVNATVLRQMGLANSGTDMIDGPCQPIKREEGRGAGMSVPAHFFNG